MNDPTKAKIAFGIVIAAGILNGYLGYRRAKKVFEKDSDLPPFPADLAKLPEYNDMRYSATIVTERGTPVEIYFTSVEYKILRCIENMSGDSLPEIIVDIVNERARIFDF